jgi:hypothetical protein
MNGKIVAGAIVIAAAVAGAVMYYLQVYGFYEPVSATSEIEVTTVGGTPEPLFVEGFEGVDAESSPLRFRACFTVPVSLATLTETYRIAERPVPLIGPPWFDCYDAAAIAAALEAGEAVAFVGTPDIRPGVDRIVAVFRDGRGFAWHQLNGSLDAPSAVDY